MSDRNAMAVLKHQMAALDQQRAQLCVWLAALLREAHGGQARVSMEMLIEMQRGIYSVQPKEDQGSVVFTVHDKANRPLVTALPSGLSAAQMAGAVCGSCEDGVVHLDEDALAQLFEAFYDNCKRAELELVRPKVVEPVSTAAEPPVERCQECWLAFGEHRPGCTKGMTTYVEALAALRRYAESQKECGNPATLKDLREYRTLKNMPQEADFDANLLAEINGYAPAGKASEVTENKESHAIPANAG